TWQRRDVPKEAGPGALRKTTNLLTEAVRAVVDVSKAFTSHGTGLVAGSARRPMPFGAPEVRAERRGSSERTYGMSRLPLARGKGDIGRMRPTGAKLFAMINMGVAAGPDLLRIGERMPVTANLLISNPYGIPKPLYLNGGRLDYFMPLVGPSLGVRVAVGFMSYADETYVALISTRSAVPGIDRLARLVERSFRELERASRVPAAERRASRVRKKPTRRSRATATRAHA